MLSLGCQTAYADPWLPLSMTRIYINDPPIRAQIRFTYSGSDSTDGLFPVFNGSVTVNGVTQNYDASLVTSAAGDFYYLMIYASDFGLEQFTSISSISVSVNSAGLYTLTENSLLPLISAVTGQINVPVIVKFLALAIVIPIGILFMWWIIRKAIRMIMAALRRGKASA